VARRAGSRGAARPLSSPRPTRRALSADRPPRASGGAVAGGERGVRTGTAPKTGWCARPSGRGETLRAPRERLSRLSARGRGGGRVSGLVSSMARSSPPGGVFVRMRDAERTSVREKDLLSAHTAGAARWPRRGPPKWWFSSSDALESLDAGDSGRGGGRSISSAVGGGES
jgi:hypothetical protein